MFDFWKEYTNFDHVPRVENLLMLYEQMNEEGEILFP